MRYHFTLAACSTLLTISLGCGGPSLTSRIVFEKSMKNDVDKVNLTEQSASNVKVYTEIPQVNYYVLESYNTIYSYQKNSISDKKIEKKEHLSELRKRAGKCGANGIIVIFSDQAYDRGGGQEWFRPGLDVLHSDNMSVEHVKSFAIHCE